MSLIQLFDTRQTNRTSLSLSLAAVPTVRHVRRRPAARAQVHAGQARLVLQQQLQRRQSRQHQLEMQLGRAGVEGLGRCDALHRHVEDDHGLVQSDHG